MVPDSDAHKAGLQEGDQVLSVNDVDFQDIEHSRVSQKIYKRPFSSAFWTLKYNGEHSGTYCVKDKNIDSQHLFPNTNTTLGINSRMYRCVTKNK